LNKYFLYFGLLLLGFGAGYFSKSASIPAETSTEVSKNSDFSASKKNKETTDVSEAKDIPQKVLDVLVFVDKNERAPEGHVGGRTFKNLEKLLPKNNENGDKIKYQEWDVNPKKEGRNRGAERLVTGNDRSAYFTNDHYNSFKKIR
jgi:ribonuclease T1